MSTNKISSLLSGNCPECHGKICEIKLEDQHFTKRVFCYDCKTYGDGHTFGNAYYSFLLHINIEEI